LDGGLIDAKGRNKKLLFKRATGNLAEESRYDPPQFARRSNLLIDGDAGAF
jgi:hypothetical protein